MACSRCLRPVRHCGSLSRQCCRPGDGSPCEASRWRRRDHVASSAFLERSSRMRSDNVGLVMRPGIGCGAAARREARIPDPLRTRATQTRGRLSIDKRCHQITVCHFPEAVQSIQAVRYDAACKAEKASVIPAFTAAAATRQAFGTFSRPHRPHQSAQARSHQSSKARYAPLSNMPPIQSRGRHLPR